MLTLPYSHWNDHLSTARRCSWHYDYGARRQWQRLLQKSSCATSQHRICLHLHIFLCFNLGASECISFNLLSPNHSPFVLKTSFIRLTFIPLFLLISPQGPIAWVVTGEIFPLKTRAKSLSMTTATNWLLNWAIAYSTPYLVNYGPGNANLQSKIFFIWFACCFLCITFVYFMIYETKGLTLEQIDELYE